MEILPDELRRASLSAVRRLTEGARQTAVAAAEHRGFAGVQTTMAQVAQSAVFADALVGALRARIAEAKAATR